MPDNATVADIGADHGKLLVYLADQKKLITGIAGELNRGPWENATSYVRKAGWQSKIDVRLGDGLAVIHEPVDAIVIAGMGGALITGILAEGLDKLAGVNRLILQPNIGEYRVREWLYEQGWSLIAEEIVLEDGIYYEIIVAEHSNTMDHNYAQLPFNKERFYQIGPLLWTNRQPLLLPKLELLLQRKQAVAEQLAGANVDSAIEKRKQIQTEIEDIKQVIKWLSVEKN